VFSGLFSHFSSPHLPDMAKRPSVEGETMKIIRFDEVMAKTGLKHSALYNLMAQGSFPKPVPLGLKARGWLESEVNDWIANRVAERDSTRRVA
jgi:prophage regulatory protein